jgi:hypothetical protein
MAHDRAAALAGTVRDSIYIQKRGGPGGVGPRAAIRAGLEVETTTRSMRSIVKLRRAV